MSIKDRLEEERELLRRLLEKEGLSAPGAQATQGLAQEQPSSSQQASGARPSLFPLSYQQEQLWFLDRFNPGTAFYNVPLILRLKGYLDVATLEHSLREVVRRHEILRTCFVMDEDGNPMQKIGERLDVRVPVMDLRHLEPDAREEQAKKIVAEKCSEAFDLSRAPLFRGVLVRIEEADHVLGLILHHSICDEWSMGVLMEEWGQLYEAYGSGEESPLAELEMQYGEYALEQREGLRGEKFQQQMEYWKGQLEGMPQVLELPADHVRPAQQSFRGGMKTRGLERDLLDGLNAIGRGEGASLFMTLLAAFQALLMRYTGQEDFGVGVSITNRSRTSTHGLIGYFVNTLVIRANLGGRQTFREILRQVRQTALNAYEHQDLPFEKLVEELAPDRDLSCGPLIQVMFTVPRLTDSEFGPFQLSEFETDVRTSKFDLTMYVEESKEPSIALNYSTDLFETETIERMMGHYERLLKAVVENPEQRVWELPLLTGEEKDHLQGWSHPRDYRCDKTVSELFEKYAARMPNNVAVEYRGEELTYRELNRKANQLAHYLRTIGVKPETRVAIGVERGLEMVVGMLAVLKAGGAYVPLDLSYPEQRLQFILQDSAPVALLAQSDLRGLPGGIEAGIQIVGIDNEIVYEGLPETNLERVETGVDPESLAYVIYTSGSTGEPKGSEIPHRSIPGFIFGTDYVRFGQETVLLQHSSVSWDPLTLELWGALLTGGRSVLAHQQRVTSAEEIREYVRGRGVNTLWLTAALFNSIVESDVKCLDGVKYLMTGGETASVTHIRRALKELPGMQLVNGYGPSECTVFSSCYVVPADLPEGLISLPIGKPIGDRRMYVLDPWMNVVPIGVVGEGFIGGASVARGYLQRPDLTAERFVPDPFGAEGGGRLYRTGDLVRWRKDGTIEFVGRNDFQVKVRGFRIELGEIEAILQQQSGVQGCAVVAKTGANGSKRLVAYVVGNGNREALRRDLKGKLPAYMIPNAIVGLQELPLTSNGKLDRQALEKLEDLDWGDSEEYEAPRTAVEEQLEEIWAAVLGVTRVGRHRNFFDLGGHSLLAASVASRCRNVFGLDVAVRAIFESPTIAELAEVIELELKSEHKSAIPARRSSASRPSVFPLSCQQEQLWFLDRFQPGSDFYNVPFVIRLKGELDASMLERSLREVVRRHEILRTCFVADENGEPTQRVISERLDVRLPLMDLQYLDLNEREERAQKIIAEQGSTAFDLGQAPLLRGVLLRIGEREHVFGLTLHHILCDEWSLGVLMEELVELYEQEERGEESKLPQLTMQYGEYALEQRKELREGKFQRQMEYWKAQLAGMPQVLELQTDQARQARQSFRGGIQHQGLESDLLAGLNALGRAEGASPFMTLLAVFQVLLMRYTGQEDFGVGTSIANRSHRNTQQLIGFFLNTLVMRARLGGEPTFREVLRHVRQAALDGYEHQDLPYQKLVEELAPDREISRNPLVQVMFTVRKPVDSKVGRFEVGEFKASIQTSKFDLTMIVEESDQAKIALNYSTDLFEPATVARMLGHYERLLKAAVENPEQRVWDLPLLTDAETAQLVQWNHTGRDYERDRNAAELFEECAARMPNAVAVEYEGQELTYEELDRRSNRLAHDLRELGVRAEQRVAICLERGVEMVVGLLAVLKTGGAYVPLDPEYPQEHLHYVLQDSAPLVLLTQRHLQGILGAIAENVVVVNLSDVSSDAARSRHLPKNNPERTSSVLKAGHLAYLIYTSGSTGKPKGVMVSHRNLVSSTFARKMVYGDLGRFLLLSSISFDSSVAGIFGSLLHGGTLIIASRDVVRDPLLLRQEVQRRKVESLLCVPSLYKHFLEYPAAREQKKQLRRVIVAGEVCPQDLVLKSAQQEPQVELFNEYGPTEATVWASVHRCVHTPGRQSVPIGRPIANTRMYILDARGGRVPIGVLGELHIGGAGVARGYWDRPELTAERFVPDPFADDGPARMYKTGDLVRWLPDGTIEFIGRNDSQVKIRGYRVELGEIERVLREHPAVQEAAVSAREDAAGGRKLVAFVVEHRSKEPGLRKSPAAAENGRDSEVEIPVGGLLNQTLAADLRRALKKKLPEHMIPVTFMTLESLPLTANGKIDRQALPAVPALGLGDDREGYEAPRTAVEERLAEIWASILGGARVGRSSNFFDLGGHSLLATSMVARFRSAFGTDVPVRTVFESPTIAELAEVIELDLKSQRRKLPQAGQRATPKRGDSGARPSAFPLSHQQEQLWFLDRFQPDSDFYNVPFAWTLKGDLDVPRLERSLREVVRRHEILRTSFVMGDDQEPIQKVVEEVDIRFPLVDLRQLDAGEREKRARKIVEEEAGKGFDLRQLPLFRGVLVRIEEKEHVFGLTLHHIICDDWSLRVLMEEWGALYEAYGRGEESPLADLGMQYGDYAAQQREGLRGGKLQQQMDYWKAQLSGMPQVLELPTDLSRPARQSFRGRIEAQSLPGDLWEGLNAVARGERASSFMTLLAAFQVLLMRYSGQEDFGVGTPVSNRKWTETERMIGFFLNTLVIRANLRGEPTFREALQRVRQAALGGYEHQDLSFEKLVEELAPDRDVSRTPVFQVLFTSLGEPDKLEFGGLEWGGFEMDLKMAKFDLTISVQDAVQGAMVTVNYTTDLFEPETIQRMMGHYEQLLKAIVENPGQRVWNLPMLTGSERAQLEGWNQTARDCPRDKTIAGLFEEYAASTPETVAVEYDGRELKYGDLNRQANRLAHYLRALGVKPNTLVAICVERSLEMIVGLFAVMKAGGAYTPLDPAYPEERLRFMIEDSMPAVLLTQSHLRGMFTGIRDDLKVVDLGSAQEWSNQRDSNPDHTTIGLTAEDLVYVIYTSGSTGTPKGVAMSARAAMNLLAWQINESAYAGHQRTLQFAPLGFDVSYQEIFSTLCAGGTLVLIDEEKRRDSTHLTRYVLEKGIQRLFLPYVGLQMLAEGVAQRADSSDDGNPFDCVLQEINVAGEQLRIDDKIRKLFLHLKHCRLNNHYGPTETHAATAFHLGTQGDLWPTLPSIGRPIANARIYIVDKHQMLVPVGVAGELFIGGAGVARGYWNQPDLTAQRFLKNRFTKEDGARMYRTGDLGRWRRDGTIEFIGRNDSQVKIRGYRVELGEIEAMLQQQSGVRGSAVVAKTSGNGSKRLVAYVVGDRDHEELRRELKSKLPAYMVPNVIVGLRELPQSDNGKVDRQALEKLEDEGLSAEHYEAPGTATEERLAEIWAEVLEVSRVGRQDNFFDLGGHSLLATLLATRLESAFGIHVPVRAVFESPTIAELAEVIETGLKSEGKRLLRSDQSEAPKKVASGPRPSLFPLSYQQEQLWFLDRLNPDNAFYNVPMTWRLKGDLDVPRLERSLRELVRRHEILRTCIVAGEQEEPKQKVLVDSIEMRLPALDLRHLEAGEREERARKVLAEEAGRTFDLSQAPLLRAALVRMGEREHVVGLTLHHIVCDDWSLGILMGELGKLYEAFGKGEGAPLADLGMQYGDYALEQREEMSGGRFERQMEYWRGQLEEMPHVLELPTDLARPPRQSFRGATEHRILQSDLWERLNALGRQEKANSLMMLLAASQVLLMRYSGQEDFGIGTVVANRKRKETRGLIGFFLNTLVIRANLRGEPSFREVLRRVREAVLSGYEYQDLSFEKLVEELAPDRDLSRSPLFQVAFILRRAFEGESEFGGLELVPFELDPGTSKFDLIVSVEERKQSAIIALNYTTDLFEAETIRGMLEQYERLLEGIVADVDQPIWSLPMMRKSEEEALSAWNFAGRVAHAGQNIVEIFDAQAENRPEEPAAVFGETRLSWAELGRRASQLAQYLVHQGVAPESQVGIFMHESPEMMVAILGVLKAGGAYVLLDVLDPKDRLRSIVDRSGIAVLLAMENLRRRLPQTHAQVVCLDSEQEAIGRQSATNPSVQINPQGLACVIYTAASEKHFKGWMVEHSGLLCLVATPGIADSTHQNGHAPGNRLPEICSRLTSSSFLAGTSAFLTSVAEGERTKFRSSGNAEIYLLDPHLRRVAIGIPGELWISGPAAGRGYLGRPSLTAEKFLPNPFTSGMGARMRRSGVKARYRRDGTIEFLGRLDDQVEIGGFQMELGEIEAALTNHEIVREAVAVVRPNGELVAYVVLDDGKRMGQNDLGDYLYERLPSYMIPGAFITLQELPRTAGGEVDRAALAVLGQEQLNKETVLPRTELERTIAAAWQSVLAVDQVGVHDNFFDLGGHSLLMIQLHQKLRRELPVEIELLHLFQFPTIDSLGRFLHTGYNFDEKSRETQDRAGKQKSAHQKFKRIHTP